MTFFDAFWNFIAGFFNIPIVLLTAFLTLFGFSAGCGADWKTGGIGSTYERGTKGPFQHIVPQDSLRVTPSVAGTMDIEYFSTNSTGCEIEEASYATSQPFENGPVTKSLTVKGVRIAGHAVDIIDADTRRVKVTYEGTVLWSDSFWNGLDKTINTAMTNAQPLLKTWVDGNVELAKADPGLVQMIAQGLFESELKKLMNSPTPLVPGVTP